MVRNPIPDARIALISLSSDNRPNVINVASNTAIGTERANIHARFKNKYSRIVKKSNPFPRNLSIARSKKFTKSIQRRAATIGGQDMNDYPLKMLIFNRARLVKNSKNRIPYGLELIQKYKRESWIVFTENKKQAKEFNNVINKKGFKSGIYNTDLNDDERQENLDAFKSGQLNVLVSCTALDEGFDMPEADGAMILSASSSKRQRIQRMGRVLRITANKENALIVTVYSSKTEYEKLREESNRYKLEGVPVKWQQMTL